MFELDRHIETLLLENDCVIVPNFGGFVTYYSPAHWSDEENVFLPPARIIGFNPQLTINDGMLVQSYMKTYNTNFSDAAKIVDNQVNLLAKTLHEEGKAELPNIGEIICSVHGDYTFKPYDYKMTSPLLYGLDMLEIPELKSLQKNHAEKKLTLPDLSIPAKWLNPDIKINRAVIRNVAAVAAAILLFFFMSTPVENTYVENEHYAQLISTGLLDKLDKESLLTTPIHVSSKPAAPATTKTTTVKKEEHPATEHTVPAATPARQTTEVVNKPYHLIVSSVARKTDADLLVRQLKSQGHKDAQTLISGNRIRVSIKSYANREEAEKQLLELRKHNEYQSSWLFVK